MRLSGWTAGIKRAPFSYNDPCFALQRTSDSFVAVLRNDMVVVTKSRANETKGVVHTIIKVFIDHIRPIVMITVFDMQS